MKSVLLAVAMVVVGFSSVESSARDFDHTKVVGAQKCVQCHKKENTAWQETHHFKVFNTLHKSDDAKKISDAMGIKNIKKDPTCAGCHYTVNKTNEPIAGISCESCHGPAANWVDLHNDYGGKDVKKDQETAEHKAKRFKDAEAGGMLRPENVYNVAQNCFQCHTVPNEKLVEVGGHKAGSDFELVSWSQGEVRHNFQRGAGKNAEATPERKRVLYVVGRLLDLEYGLRGVAEVTKANKYAVEMAKRTKRAIEYLKQINGAMPDGKLQEAQKIGEGAELKPNNKAALLGAAEKVKKIAQEMAMKDGATLAAVDSLIPGEPKGHAVP